MATSLLGIDIGTDSLKLALVNSGEVKRLLRIPVPDDSLQYGLFVSAEPLGKLLRDTLKGEGIRVHDAAVTLPHDAVLTRHVVLSCASDDEAVLALPNKFEDITREGRRRYLFDYLTLDTPSQIPGEPVEILAACTRRSFVDNLSDAMREAGLRLVKASPAVCSYISLIRALQEGEGASYLEYFIADFGNHTVRLHMFRGDRHMAEYTLSAEFPQAADDAGTMDEFITEFSAALEHYRSGHPRSPMTHVWPIGGGAFDPALHSILSDRLKLRVHRAAELIPSTDALPDAGLYAQAVGIALYRPGREPQ